MAGNIFINILGCERKEVMREKCDKDCKGKERCEMKQGDFKLVVLVGEWI